MEARLAVRATVILVLATFGVAQAQDQYPQASQVAGSRSGEKREGRFAHHLSLSVDRPKSTSIMVMIQKRTTTWLSFQPSSS
mgnify:CR=1 FL=1